MNMPDEIFVLMVIALGGGLVLGLVSQIFTFVKWKIERESSGGAAEQSSLTTSELEKMMRRAVEEATQPLVDRVESLEDELALHPKQLTGKAEKGLLDLDDDLAEEPVLSRRKRVR